MAGCFHSETVCLIAGAGSFHRSRFCGLAAGAYRVVSAIVVIAHAIAAILAGTVACTLVPRKRRLFDYCHVEDFHGTYYRRRMAYR